MPEWHFDVRQGRVMPPGLTLSPRSPKVTVSFII